MTFGNTKTGKTGTSTSDATETAQIKSVESLDKDNDMERGLKNRHVQFIAIGGTIGTGLFLGSGKSIALTGPSIISCTSAWASSCSCSCAPSAK